MDLLERDGLAERDTRGAVAALDWVGTIRRWTQDYDVLTTNPAASYLQPGGLDALTDRLRTATTSYAVTLRHEALCCIPRVAGRDWR